MWKPGALSTEQQGDRSRLSIKSNLTAQLT